MAYELIETIEVGAGGAASIEFTSIPQDGVDLLLKVSGRIANTVIFSFTINSNTSAVYSGIRLAGNGSSPFTSSFTSASSIFAGYVPIDSQYTANTFSNNAIYLSNYTSSANKSFSSDGVNEQNDAFALQAIFAGQVADTNPITSIQLIPDAAQLWVSGTTASLYKIF